MSNIRSMVSLPTYVWPLFLQGQMFVVHRIQHGLTCSLNQHLLAPYGIIIWNGFSTSDSSSSSCSHLAVGSLRQTQFSSSQFCHGLRLSSFRWLCMSRLTQSINLCFGLPLFLLPGGTISRVFLPTYSWSRLFTWPNYISLAFLHLSVMFSTFSFFLMSSFLTWSL